MANISITIPDALLPRVVNGLATFYGYKDTLEDGTPNSQTKGQFAKAQLINHIKHCVKQVETDEAVNLAREAKRSEVESSITLS